MRLRSLLLLHWPAALLAAGCGDYRTVEPQPTATLPLPVVGQVVDWEGRPIAGVTVASGESAGFDGASTTDADGRFLLWVKRRPYDLAVVVSASGIVQQATVYLGVTRPDPLVRRSDIPGSAPLGAHQATLEGTIAAPCSASPCPPGGVKVIAGFEPGPNGLAITSTPLTGSFTYRLPIAWMGPASLTGRLDALAWSWSPGAPVQYWYGTAPATVTDGAPSTVDIPTLLPPATGIIAGTIGEPAGARVTSVALYHSVGDESLYWGARAESLSSAAFAYDIPAVPGVSTMLWVSGTGATGEVLSAGWTRVSAGSTDLAVDLRPAPTPLEPAAGATGVGPGTRIAWTPVPGSVSIVWFGPVQLHTVGGEALLPDFSALGLGYPAGAAGTWAVTANGAFGSVDGWLEPPPAGPKSWWGSTAVERSFTFR